MKTKFKILYFLSLPMMLGMGCGDNKQQVDDNQKTAAVFANPQDAAKKAKQDMLAVLSKDTSINLGVDRASLENAETGKVILQSTLNFEKLLNADSSTSISSLVQGEENSVVPLMHGQEVATIVELSHDDKGWKVAALGSKTMSDELNKVMRASQTDSLGAGSVITLYQVANLKSRIYGVKENDREMFYTNYSSRFSLQKGINQSELLQILKEDAIRFQKEFGDKLKREKLTD